MKILTWNNGQFIIKILFFGILYIWLFMMFIFFAFPEHEAKRIGASAAGWMMIGYPLITLILTLLYLLLIFIYGHIDKKANSVQHYKLLGYSLGTTFLLIVISIIFRGIIK